MPTYSVTAVKENGEEIKKSVDFANEAELYDYLATIGADVIDIKEKPFYYKYLDFRKIFGKISRQEVIEILGNLQIIVKSGLPTNMGLFDLAKDSENPLASSMLSDIAFRVQMGESLSKSMERYSKVFGETAVSLVRIGEETGELDATLKDAADHLKKIGELKSKAASALIYPAVSFFGLFGAMLFWLIVVMPQIMDAFQSFDMELPPATVFIQNLSFFLQNNILYILITFAALVAGIYIGRRKYPRFRFETDKLILKIPVVGALQKNFNLAFFAEYVRLMISAGLPLYQALTIIEDSMGNTVFKTALGKAKEAIADGASFSSGLERQNLFPSLVVRMLGVGEQTGRLEEQLEYVAKYYYDKVDYLAQNMAKIIEPAILIFVGVFMMVIMIGLLGPVYDLLGSVTAAGK